MNRRNFMELLAMSGAAFTTGAFYSFSTKEGRATRKDIPINATELSADVVIAGAGVGGFAAAMAALRNGRSVILTEQTDWMGGQLTQQGLSCLDEHRWIESFGATKFYRDFRTAVRKYYQQNYPLTDDARNRKYLNPGNGLVSLLCFEPRVALNVLYDFLAPYLSSGNLQLLLNTKIVEADFSNDKVRSLKSRNTTTGKESILSAPYFIDATELGDLLPLTKTEYVTGAESKQQTKELHAAEVADPKNQQAITFCIAMDYFEGENHLINKPAQYDFWKNYIPKLSPSWPGKLLQLSYSNPSTLQPKMLGFDPRGNATGKNLNLWNYRKIIDQKNFKPGAYNSDITIVNWPQNDFMTGNIVDVTEEEYKKNIEAAKQLSLSLFYWLQTEAPRQDGENGWPGLRLRPDIMGTEDGLAKYPYIREARRIKPVFTILEEHVGKENRSIVAGKEATKAADFFDSVGVGYYHIDLHPTTAGNNYIDFDSLPFQIPLGALLPQRMENLIASSKNIGTTHITNGCYRLHHVEWNIGEAAGMLIAFALKKKVKPKQVREQPALLNEFQNHIRSQGIETHWPQNL
ncbi:MAG: FAD-dependent oxidoreductase [Ginsengibacter sp.]